jgi:hypothetical protein
MSRTFARTLCMVLLVAVAASVPATGRAQSPWGELEQRLTAIEQAIAALAVLVGPLSGRESALGEQMSLTSMELVQFIEESAAGIHEAVEFWALSDLSRRAYTLGFERDGAGATDPSACPFGYHMASIWEIVNPAALRYVSFTEGSKRDMGSGPSPARGWVRTGQMNSNEARPIVGAGNCRIWTSNDPQDYGTLVSLGATHWDAPATAISPWTAEVAACSTTTRVWCVEDQN